MKFEFEKFVPKPKKEIRRSYAIAIQSDVYNQIQEIADKHQTTMMKVASELLGAGLKIYRDNNP